MRLGASVKSQSKGQTVISISSRGKKESKLTLMCMNGTPMLDQGGQTGNTD